MFKTKSWTVVAALLVSGLFWCPFARADGPLPSLDELLKVYQDLGYPLPPKGAKLYKVERFSGGKVKEKGKPEEYYVAFLTKPGTKTENPHFLSGYSSRQPWWNPVVEELKLEPAAFKGLDLGWLDFVDKLLLPLAIQCHYQGHEKLAKFLLEQHSKDKEHSPLEELVQEAWWEVIHQLTEPKEDRTPLARRMRELIRKYKEVDTNYNQGLLKSLELALAPRASKPGSVEAMIDKLVDYSARTGTVGIFDKEECYWRIARLGFDAVPALIAHLEDERLTRSKMEGFNNFRSWHLRVGNVVGDLLEGIAGDALDRDWLQRQQGIPLKKSNVLEWWKDAQQVGEEAYLLANIFPDKKNSVRKHLLECIVDKYPRHIPSLYQNLLDKRPDLQSWPLVEAVLQVKLSPKEKSSLLLAGAKHKSPDHRLTALRALAQVDRRLFTGLLFTALESLPKDVSQPYWQCPEAWFAPLAIEADDPRVWALLEMVARRSSLGLRMEILEHFSDSKDVRYRKERIRLLESFLDDAEIRDNKSSEQFSGPGAGYRYQKLSVRDLVALELARLFEMEIEVAPNRTVDEWAAIREQVRNAVMRELKDIK